MTLEEESFNWTRFIQWQKSLFNGFFEHRSFATPKPLSKNTLCTHSQNQLDHLSHPLFTQVSRDPFLAATCKAVALMLLGLSIMARCSNKRRTTSTCDLRVARCKALSFPWSLVSWSLSTPSSNKSLTASRCPSLAAKCKGLSPRWVTWSMSKNSARKPSTATCDILCQRKKESVKYLESTINY